MRVIAGEAKGRRLATPPGLGTRPVTDRVKESLFGSLGAAVVDAVVADLYAGSGALGIEALSRGAASAVFVERDRGAAEVVAGNLEVAGFAEVARVERADVRAFVTREPGEAFTLVFCDPPFAVPTAEVEQVLVRLASGWVVEGASVVVRRRVGDGAPSLPEGWRFLREKAFGDTLVLVATAG